MSTSRRLLTTVFPVYAGGEWIAPVTASSRSTRYYECKVFHLPGVDPEQISILRAGDTYFVRGGAKGPLTIAANGLSAEYVIPRLTYEGECTLEKDKNRWQSMRVVFEHESETLVFSVQHNNSQIATDSIGFTSNPKQLPDEPPPPRVVKKRIPTAPALPTPTEITMPTLTERITQAPVVQTALHDGADAAWRMAGNQLVKLTREPFVAMLAKKLAPGDESVRLKLAAFLETDLGIAIFTALLSAGLSALPNVAFPGIGPGHIPRLAKELRVNAMAGAGDVVADLLMGPLRETLCVFLQGTAASGDLPPLPFQLDPPSAPLTPEAAHLNDWIVEAAKRKMP